ncbi:MAG: hypothetical protein HYX51_05930, partial [Chloroflexi bacterium]|nr:hypothetical protein [Chloroflexota bacterium]
MDRPLSRTPKAGDALSSRRSMGRWSPVALAERRGIHYGWIVVAVTFVTVITAAGV